MFTVTISNFPKNFLQEFSIDSYNISNFWNSDEPKRITFHASIGMMRRGCTYIECEENDPKAVHLEIRNFAGAVIYSGRVLEFVA